MLITNEKGETSELERRDNLVEVPLSDVSTFSVHSICLHCSVIASESDDCAFVINEWKFHLQRKCVLCATLVPVLLIKCLKVQNA